MAKRRTMEDAMKKTFVSILSLAFVGWAPLAVADDRHAHAYGALGPGAEARVRHEREVRTLQAQEEAASKVAAAARDSVAALPAGAVLVKVTRPGFEPARIEAHKGQKVVLAFLRTDERSCGDKVVFPELKLERALPVGRAVLVELVPTRSGELAFACGMDMLRGSLVVQ